MTNSNQNSKKEYFLEYSCACTFFVPHAKANHLNAQEVVHELVSSAKDISTATWNCFEDGRNLVIDGKIVANLIFEIQSKLEMIEKILPLAFEYAHVEVKS